MAVCPRTLGVLLLPLQAVLVGVVGDVVVTYSHRTLYLKPNLPAPCSAPLCISSSFFVFFTAAESSSHTTFVPAPYHKTVELFSIKRRLSLGEGQKKKSCRQRDNCENGEQAGVETLHQILLRVSEVFSVEGLQVRLCVSRQ